METKIADRRSMYVVGLPQGDLHGHINPMLSFCRTLNSRCDVHVTLVVTENWLRSASALTQEAESGKIKFVTLPNDVLPPSAAGGTVVDFHDFLEAVETDMVGPVERLLDQLDPPPDLILADGFLAWAVGLGKRRNIPVAAFWPAAASLFLVALHQHLILGAHSFPLDYLSGEERIDSIPGIPSIRLADLPGEIQCNDKLVLNTIKRAVTTAIKAECIIFRTMNELEESVLNALKTAISVPIYPVGPAIPYFAEKHNHQTPNNNTPKDCIKWLDTQQQRSILYVSLGTVLPTSNAHIDELAIAVGESGVPFLWVARERASHLSHILGDKGMVVSWCDQRRVLSHSSIGGFLTHCGWNSTLEAAFAGVPVLTFPLGLDQTLNNKLIVEDWGIGWRVTNNFQELIIRNHVSELLKKFMDLEREERKELDDKCEKFKGRLMLGVAKDGSTSSLDEFFFNVTK